MVSHKPKLFQLLALFLSSLLVLETHGFYMNVDEENVGGNHQILDSNFLNINEDRIEDGFPHEFSSTIIHDGKEVVLTFRKDAGADYLSANVYLNDNGGPSKADVDVKDKKHSHYKEVNGNGVATVSLNDKEFHDETINSKYRIMASVFLNSKTGQYVIMPIRIKSSRIGKRGVLGNTATIQHSLIQPDKLPNVEEILKAQEFETPVPRKPNLNENNNDEILDERKKRTTDRLVYAYAEALVVTDYSVYLAFQRFTKSTDQTVIVQAIRIYYAHLFYAINQRFENSYKDDPNLRLSVVVKGYDIATDPAGSSWSDWSRVGLPQDGSNTNEYGMEYIDGDKSYDLLNAYVGPLIPSKYDLVVGFVNKQMVGYNGLATVGTRCTKNGLALLVDNGDLLLVMTSHEIGHLLGSSHDGVPNVACPVTDSYIMVSGASLTNIAHHWQFSSCSIKQTKNSLLIDDFSAMKKTASCLANKPTNLPIETTYPAQMPSGSIWSPNDVCQNAYGSSASFCYNNYLNTSDDGSICAKLFCRRSDANWFCNNQRNPPEGTICGSGKTCSMGKCVDNPTAPTGNCLLGEARVSYIDVAQRFTFTPVAVTCDMAVSQMVAKNIDPVMFCRLSSTFKQSCCKRCALYESINSCIDTDTDCLSQSWMQKCATSSTKRAACPFTCKQCTRKTSVNCTNNLCQNGATCINEVTSDPNIGFRCVCPAGYSGTVCDKKDPCKPTNPCQNGGTCNRLASSYFCICPSQYKGYNCNESV